jgi:hypothetical protein
MRWYHILGAAYVAGGLITPVYQSSRSADGRAVWPGFPAWGGGPGLAFDSTVFTVLLWPFAIAMDVRLQLQAVINAGANLASS